jgi:hypothetical protein
MCSRRGRPELSSNTRGSVERTLLGFGLLRFPFTFLGVMALGTGLWVVVYLAGHPGLDPIARGIAAATVLICLVFGAYVVARRIRRGPQH